MAQGAGRDGRDFLCPPDLLAPVAVAGCTLVLVELKVSALSFPVAGDIRGAEQAAAG